jgi:DICT domain-containing protein
MVVVLGEGMPAEPVPGVRGADLRSDDPMLGEWAVVVVAPHFAAAFVARDLEDDGPDLERAFDYVLTYDRELVLDAARSVMARALPLVTA